jgi:hypothetical protein
MSRMYKRLQLNYPAIVLADPGTQGERMYSLKVVNISTAGAMFLSNVYLPKGTPAQVFFYLEFGPAQNILRVKFSGKVVRFEPGGFAIAFDEVHTFRLQKGAVLKKIENYGSSEEAIRDILECRQKGKINNYETMDQQMASEVFLIMFRNGIFSHGSHIPH